MLESNVHSVLMWMAVFMAMFTAIRILVEKRLKRKKTTETELINMISKSLNCSEFDIFEFGGRNWNISEGRIIHDFKDYMFYNKVPYYVRDYIRTSEGTDLIN